jgi:hypothetical protein
VHHLEERREKMLERDSDLEEYDDLLEEYPESSDEIIEMERGAVIRAIRGRVTYKSLIGWHVMDRRGIMRALARVGENEFTLRLPDDNTGTT